MKNVQNNFKVSGFVGYSEVRSFQTASVCRFSLSVGRTEKGGDVWISAFMNAEAWKKNDMEELDSFKVLTKGNMVTIEGYFKPEEWTDEAGNKRNRVTMVATKFYPTEDAAAANESDKK